MKRKHRVASDDHVVILVSISSGPHKGICLMLTLSIGNSLEHIAVDWPDHVSHQLLSVLLARDKLAFPTVLGCNQSNIGLLLKRLLQLLLRGVHLLLLLRMHNLLMH